MSHVRLLILHAAVVLIPRLPTTSQDLIAGHDREAQLAGYGIDVSCRPFDKKTFSMRQLFRDEQRKITHTILNDSLTSAAAVYRTIFESHAPLIRFLNRLSIPVPKAYVEGGGRQQDCLAHQHLEYAVRRRVEKEAEEFATNPRHPALAAR